MKLKTVRRIKRPEKPASLVQRLRQHAQSIRNRLSSQHSPKERKRLLENLAKVQRDLKKKAA